MGNITETSVFENTKKYSENHYWNYDETIYASSYLIGVDEVKTPPLRNITLLALLSECGCLTSNDGTPFPQSEIDGINNLAIVWYENDDEIHIHQIYNHDTGEIYWDYESIGDWDWTDNDDKLVGSILMYGNLESVIGVN
tara:strand:- start:111 stop:530 length:420 start_codon:yes stop_codon:yes gene_type:complete